MKKKIKDKITIVIPTKNEQETIAEVIKQCKKYANQIIVVDGHSIDKTRSIAKSLGVKVILDNKKGKGDAIRKSLEYVNNEIIVFIDADGSHETKDIPELVEPLFKNKAELVVASRLKGGSDEIKLDLNGLIRHIGGELSVIIVNYRWGVDLTDIHNGFRAIKKKAILGLNLKSNGFEIEEEIIMKCLKKGYNVLEIASHEYARKGGISKLQTRQAGKILFKLFLEVFNFN
ncbi:glycosyltransferase family 2 protein [Patescibacteria group bacterium]